MFSFFFFFNYLLVNLDTVVCGAVGLHSFIMTDVSNLSSQPFTSMSGRTPHITQYSSTAAQTTASNITFKLNQHLRKTGFKMWT